MTKAVRYPITVRHRAASFASQWAAIRRLDAPEGLPALPPVRGLANPENYSI